MAFDDEKSFGDLILPDEYNTLVDEQKKRVVGESVDRLVVKSSGNTSPGTSGRVVIEQDTGRVLVDTGSQFVEVGLTDDQIDLSNLGSLDAGSQTISNVSDPTNEQDVATKSFVEAVAQGLNLKDSVRATDHDQQIDLTGSTDPNPLDGVTLSDGDRVLLKHQDNAVENGIYVAVTATDPSTWERAPDFDEDSEVSEGAFTFVEDGNTHADESYVVSTNDPITVGTTPINWAQFASAGSIEGGQGLQTSGGTLDVRLDIDNGGSDVTGAFGLDFQSDFSVTDDGDNTVSIGLSSDSVSIAGNSVNLGGSTGISHSDLGSIADDDHHAKFTDGDAQNAVEGNVEVDSLQGNNGTSGQVLSTDGSNLSFTTIEGFSGSFTDLTDVPNLGTTAEERAVLNKLVADTAENTFKNNLDALSFEGGFFDVFNDTSKISSTNQAVVNTIQGGDNRGTVELAPALGAPSDLIIDFSGGQNFSSEDDCINNNIAINGNGNIFDLETGNQIDNISGGSLDVNDEFILQNNNLFDVQTRDKIRNLPFQNTAMVDIDRNNDAVATSDQVSGNDSVLVDAETGNTKQTFQNIDVDQLICQSDNYVFGGGSNGTFRILDKETGNDLLNVGANSIFGDIAADRDQVIYRNNNGNVDIREIQNDLKLNALQRISTLNESISDPIEGHSFSSLGLFLYVLTSNNLVQISLSDPDTLFSTREDTRQFVGYEDVFVSADGSTMFLLDPNGPRIEKYEFGTVFQISTLSKVGELSLPFPTVEGFSFNSDGDQIYVAESDVIHQLNLPAKFDISSISEQKDFFTENLNKYNTASLKQVNSASLGSNSSSAEKFLLVGSNQTFFTIQNDTIFKHKLSAGDQDLSGGVDAELQTGDLLNIKDKDTGDQAPVTDVQDVEFKNGGGRFYIVDNDAQIIEINSSLGGSFNVKDEFDFGRDNKQFINTFDVSTQMAQAKSMTFSPDGTKMFVGGIDTGGLLGVIAEYQLSSPFDTTTASFNSIKNGLTVIPDDLTLNVHDDTAKDKNLNTVFSQSGGEQQGPITGTSAEIDTDRVLYGEIGGEKDVRIQSLDSDRNFLTINGERIAKSGGQQGATNTGLIPEDVASQGNEFGINVFTPNGNPDIVNYSFKLKESVDEPNLFPDEGKKLAALDRSDNVIGEFEMSTAFSLDTATRTGVFDVPTNIRSFEYGFRGKTGFGIKSDQIVKFKIQPDISDLHLGGGDERTVISGKDGLLVKGQLNTIGDITTFGQTESGTVPANVSSVSFTDGGRKLFTTDPSNDMELYNATAFPVVDTKEFNDSVEGLAFNSRFIAMTPANDRGQFATFFFDRDTLSQVGKIDHTISDIRARRTDMSEEHFVIGSNRFRVFKSVQTGFQGSGSVQHTRFDLAVQGFDSPPETAVVSANAAIPDGTTISFTIQDINGNTVEVAAAERDQEIDVSNLENTKIFIESNLEQTASGVVDTPTLDDVMVHFKE